MSAVESNGPAVVRLPGNPGNRYFRLGPIPARRLGLVGHPDPDRPWQMVLGEGADPDALLVLPNGVTFTAYELTTLSYKSGSPTEGWEVWCDDPGGYPPEHFDSI